MPGMIAPPGYPPELQRFATMLKVGIPEKGVRDKMRAEGYDDDTFDEWLNPATAGRRRAEEEDEEGDSSSSDEGSTDNSEDDAKAQTMESSNKQSTKSKKKKRKKKKPRRMTDDSLFSVDASSTSDESNSDESDSSDEEKKQDDENEQSSAQQSSDPSHTGVVISRVSQLPLQHNFVPESQSALKLDALDPVLTKKTLLIVNNFIVNTASFLNSFVATCESKMHRIEKDIDRMQVTLAILEGKVDSVPWLADAMKGKILPPKPAPPVSSSSVSKSVAAAPQSSSANDGGAVKDSPSAEADPSAAASSSSSSSDPDSAVKNNPDLQRWFKMLKVGVPSMAVLNKMMSSGVDQSTAEKVIEIHEKGG